jgi:hypothetical protein
MLQWTWYLRKCDLPNQKGAWQMQSTHSETDERPMELPHSPPLACDLTAIPAAERMAHTVRAEWLMSQAVQERQELVDGYALRYGANDYADLVAFIANERLCCPFFRFTLELSPVQGPIWLRITGGEDVKEFFQSVFANRESTRAD